MECKVNKTYSPQQYSFMGILMTEKCEKREFSPIPLIEDDDFSPFLIHKTQSSFGVYYFSRQELQVFSCRYLVCFCNLT